MLIDADAALTPKMQTDNQTDSFPASYTVVKDSLIGVIRQKDKSIYVSFILFLLVRINNLFNSWYNKLHVHVYKLMMETKVV